MKLSSIHIGERSRRAMTGIESLAASIEKVGLLHPPAVRDGTRRRRLPACLDDLPRPHVAESA